MGSEDITQKYHYMYIDKRPSRKQYNLFDSKARWGLVVVIIATSVAMWLVQ